MNPQPRRLEAWALGCLAFVLCFSGCASPFVSGTVGVKNPLSYAVDVTLRVSGAEDEGSLLDETVRVGSKSSSEQYELSFKRGEKYNILARFENSTGKRVEWLGPTLLFGRLAEGDPEPVVWVRLAESYIYYDVGR